jgi:hypothetical protein
MWNEWPAVDRGDEDRLAAAALAADEGIDRLIDALGEHAKVQTALLAAFHELVAKLAHPAGAPVAVATNPWPATPGKLPPPRKVAVATNPWPATDHEINPEQRGDAPSEGNGSPVLDPPDVEEIPESYEDMRAEFAAMAAELEEPPPPPDEREIWDLRLRIYRRANVWNADWGPRPGQDGCRVPQELMQRAA